MQELHNITITPRTTQHRNIVKIIEGNACSVIQLVYNNMKKQTKATKKMKGKSRKAGDET